MLLELQFPAAGAAVEGGRGCDREARHRGPSGPLLPGKRFCSPFRPRCRRLGGVLGSARTRGRVTAARGWLAGGAGGEAEAAAGTAAARVPAGGPSGRWETQGRR